MNLLLLPIISIIFMIPLLSCAQSDKKQQYVAHFQLTIQQNNPDSIAKLVKYPLARKHPLTSIRNESEFVSLYAEIIDKNLINKVSVASIDKDWTMKKNKQLYLHSGLVWLDHKGRISKINYQSKKGNKMYKRLLCNEKKHLHASVSNFYEPVLLWQSDRYTIRIDKETPYTFRLCLWPADMNTKEAPTVVLNNGRQEYIGVSGHQHFVFEEGDYTYSCMIQKGGRFDEKIFVISHKQSVNYKQTIQ